MAAAVPIFIAGVVVVEGLIELFGGDSEAEKRANKAEKDRQEEERLKNEAIQAQQEAEILWIAAWKAQQEAERQAKADGIAKDEAVGQATVAREAQQEAENARNAANLKAAEDAKIAAEKLEKERVAREEEERKKMEAVRAHQQSEKENETKIAVEKAKNEELTVKHEQEKKENHAELITEKDKRIEEKMRHVDETDALHSKHNDEMMAMGEENYNLKRLNCALKMSNRRLGQNAMLRLEDLAAETSIQNGKKEINTKMDAIRKVIPRMEKEYKRLLKSIKKGRTPGDEDPSEAEEDLDSMKDSIEEVVTLFDDAVAVASDPKFADGSIDEMKRSLISTRDLAKNFSEGIENVKEVMNKAPQSVTLDGIEECLKALKLAVASIPNLDIKTEAQCYEEAKIKFQQANFNAIAQNEENIPE